eukprot:3803908-Prymnesium_polylepis.1
MWTVTLLRVKASRIGVDQSRALRIDPAWPAAAYSITCTFRAYRANAPFHTDGGWNVSLKLRKLRARKDGRTVSRVGLHYWSPDSDG